ncbi:MAG: sugar phosphate nucleotidyltransferase, partial [Pseudomonas sp.]|uniref:sugar phosphate nucleotidyltransferase n=1 Tax=Pseudomonas sp. TaxID=306 RepID=UPI003BB51837
MIPVILSGGSGSRLWPLSRKLYPKQFLALAGAQSLFQQTLLRVAGEGMAAPIVVCNEEHRFIVGEQLARIGGTAQAVLLEPFGRNTAPAIAIVALKLLAEGRDELLLVLPADHVLEDQPALQRALELARAAAEQGELVLFGVPASTPETGYGYIKSHPGPGDLPPGVLAVERFVEKPCQAKACEFVASGDYFWNSGMFMFRSSRYLEELKRHEPDIYD